MQMSNLFPIQKHRIAKFKCQNVIIFLHTLICAIDDISDVSSLDPMKIECDNHQESACADARDNNLLTTIYLASGTTLKVQFGPGEDLTHIAFYSHQQRPESNTVHVTITIMADAHAMDNNVHVG